MGTDPAYVPNRRTPHFRGQRASDLTALAPELQAEALGYAAEIERCLDSLLMAGNEPDAATRGAWLEMKIAVDALHGLLATGESQRMLSLFRLQVPIWDGQPRRVASVWRLKKHEEFAECELVTHPLGAEIRLAAAGEHERSEAGRDSVALVDKAMGWKRQFEDKGWS
jgi:hypothetical protein